jgi:hypothetical protein
MNITGDAHSAGFGQPLQSGRDVDAVAQEIAASDHYIANMDADAEAEDSIWINVFIQTSEGLLDFHGTLNCIHCTGELRQDAVTRCVGDPATMLLNKPVHNTAMSRQGPKGSDLVPVHEARVARDIRREDRRKPPLKPPLYHPTASAPAWTCAESSMYPTPGTSPLRHHGDLGCDRVAREYPASPIDV